MPGFLKRAEQKLLLNKPGIWSTRVHLVVYYGILFLLLLTILCFLEPNDPRDYSTAEVWVGFVSVISGVGLIVWLIYLLRFNVFKKYGIIHPLHALVTFILFFISTGVLVSFSYVHPIVESVRANMAYGDEEIVRDINDINVMTCQLEYDQQRVWAYDTVELVDTATWKPKVADDDVSGVTNAKMYHYHLDSARFYNKLNANDSVVKLKDSLYLVYNTPDYSCLSFYTYRYKMKEKLLTDFEIFRKAYAHRPTPAERQTITRQLNALIEKYNYRVRHNNYDEVAIAGDDMSLDELKKQTRLANMQTSISHILGKKYRWSENELQVFIRLFYYVTLGITLLIFIFRHTSIRTFFLSALAGVLLTIFTALILAFSHADAIHFLSCMIFYVFFFFFGTLAVWKAQKRKAVTGIMINLFTLIITALPILLLVWYYEYEYNKWRFVEGIVSRPFDLEDYSIYAEVAGALLLVVLLATYIGKLYRRWFALPED